MTARKIKRNSGCKDCDHFIGAYTKIWGYGDGSYGCRCKNKNGEEIQYEPVAGEIIKQTWEPSEQNNDCTCQGFSDEKKKKREKDEEIREIVRREIDTCDKLVSGPVWKPLGMVKPNYQSARIDKLELKTTVIWITMIFMLSVTALLTQL